MGYFFRYIGLNTKIFFRKAIKFLNEKIELRTFIVLASLIVGIITGIASAILKDFVHFLEVNPEAFLREHGIGFLLPFFPMIGIILSVIVTILFFNGTLSKGISNLIYLITRKASDVPKQDIFSHYITSGLAVGFGGSAGLEAPIVITGGAIGSNVAKGFKFNYKVRTLLLASGSAAGISAIFNSPIAGVIFAVEILLPEFSISYFIPLLIASASATVVSSFLYGGQIFYLVTKGWSLSAIPYYVVLGILCGVISFYNIKAAFFVEEFFQKIKTKYAKILIGGTVLCLMVFLLPALYGEGYISVKYLLAGQYNKIIPARFITHYIDPNLALIIISALIVITKVFATEITIRSGGNGGTIAPALFTGAFTGFFLAQLMSYLGIANVSHPNFVVVGMAGILSGILHAPLTGIFLGAEMTGGYKLIIPLMIVTALSYFISRYFHQESIYTEALVRSGIKFRSEKEKHYIRQINVRNIIETDFIILHPQITLREIMQNIVHSKRNLFPVVDNDEKLLGVITLDNIREIMLNRDVYDVILAYEVMTTDFQSIDINEDINYALEVFEENNVWNLAVTENGKYRGFISKSNIFNKYLSSWATQYTDEF